MPVNDWEAEKRLQGQASVTRDRKVDPESNRKQQPNELWEWTGHPRSTKAVSLPSADTSATAGLRIRICGRKFHGADAALCLHPGPDGTLLEILFALLLRLASLYSAEHNV